MVVIIPGPSSQKLGKEVARLSKSKLVQVESKKFSDGENYIRLKGKVKGEDVFIIQTLFPQNDSLFQLLQIIDATNNANAKKITVIIPYFAYSRQHKLYRVGEAVSANVVARAIESLGVNKVIIFNLHNRSVIKMFKTRVKNLNVAPLIADHLSKIKLKNPFVLVPDQERPELGKIIAKKLRCKYFWLEKHRNIVTGKIKTKIKRNFDVKCKEAIIVDDIVSTGSTVINAMKILKKKKVKSIYVAVVHALPINKNFDKIKKVGAKYIVSTDSIPSEISKIKLANLIAKEIK